MTFTQNQKIKFITNAQMKVTTAGFLGWIFVGISARFSARCPILLPVFLS
jgi:hypothetical protein